MNESGPDEGNLAKILNAKLALTLKVDKEEVYWEQRARTNWIRMRDHNTSFFHKATTQRKKRNMVKGLRDENGEWMEDESRLKEIASKFFMDLFLTQPTRSYEKLFEVVQSCIQQS